VWLTLLTAITPVSLKKLKMQIDDKNVTVILDTKGDCWDEIRRVRRKEDLLIKKSG